MDKVKCYCVLKFQNEGNVHFKEYAIFDQVIMLKYKKSHNLFDYESH